MPRAKQSDDGEPARSTAKTERDDHGREVLAGEATTTYTWTGGAAVVIPDLTFERLEAGKPAEVEPGETVETRYVLRNPDLEEKG